MLLSTLHVDTVEPVSGHRGDTAKCPYHLERCPYKRGQYDNVKFMSLLIVLSVQ